ncbi:MAG: hypothetical protein EPGJADBJ_01039 [Saprospiraceae bacterium]|nr:hypothetical protein [Saprospiraceae bacterium]
MHRLKNSIDQKSTPLTSIHPNRACHVGRSETSEDKVLLYTRRKVVCEKIAVNSHRMTASRLSLHLKDIYLNLYF